MLEVHNTSVKLSPMDVEFILYLKVKGLRIDMKKEISRSFDPLKGLRPSTHNSNN